MLALPSICILTPSYNQAPYLEAAMRSVLDQGYPGLEYGIVDGGSSDGSVDIIRQYADRLAFWTSGPDGGQYAALNKGFASSSSEIMAWINSDDMYLPGALQVVAEIFAAHPKIEWLTSLYPLTWDQAGRAVACQRWPGYTRRGFFRGENLVRPRRYANAWIQQESTFWRRSLWERAGGQLNTDFKLAADFELWARFFTHADLYGVETVLGGFRLHPAQKTAQHMDAYVREAETALRLHGGRLPGFMEALWRVAWSRYLPSPLRRKLPFLEAFKTCRFNARGNAWDIVRS